MQGPLPRAAFRSYSEARFRVQGRLPRVLPGTEARKPRVRQAGKPSCLFLVLLLATQCGDLPEGGISAANSSAESEMPLKGGHIN